MDGCDEGILLGIQDVGEEDAEATIKDIQEKNKLTPDVHKEILNTLEEYRPMLTKAINLVTKEQANNCHSDMGLIE